MVSVPLEVVHLNKGYFNWLGLFHVDHHNFPSYPCYSILWGLHLSHRVGFQKAPDPIGFLILGLDLIRGLLFESKYKSALG
jgi:hypothetical protein